MWAKAQGEDAQFYHDERGKLVLDEKGKPIVLRPGSAPDTGMQIFLSKNLLGYTDKQSTEITGKDGKPIQVETKPDLSHLSDKELETIGNILSTATNAAGGHGGESPAASP
jgi:hypothetical protein